MVFLGRLTPHGGHLRLWTVITAASVGALLGEQVGSGWGDAWAHA